MSGRTRWRALTALLALMVGGAAPLAGEARAADPVPDGAYCAYGQVQGNGTWTPPMTTAVIPHAFTMALQANCTGAGDEAGNYTINLSGSGTENCAAGSGSGSVSGSGPEGSFTGSFSYYKAGAHAVHYYIMGTYNTTSPAEPHELHLWMDVLPVVSTSSLCFYSTAGLIGHGAVADTPSSSSGGGDSCQYTASVHFSNGIDVTPLTQATGTYTLLTSSLVCGGTVIDGVGSLTSTGNYGDLGGRGTFAGTFATSTFTVGGPCSGTVNGTWVGDQVTGNVSITCGGRSGSGTFAATMEVNPTTAQGTRFYDANVEGSAALVFS